jgi:hypothetical protein
MPFSVQLERENHICRPPASAYPTPGKSMFHVSLHRLGLIFFSQPFKMIPPSLCLLRCTRSVICAFQMVSLPRPSSRYRRAYFLPDDILQDTCKISRKTNQALLKSAHSESTPLPPQTPAAETGPPSVSTSTICGRRRISFSDAVKRVQGDSASSSKPTHSRPACHSTHS